MDIGDLVERGTFVVVDVEGDGGVPRQGPLEIALVRFEGGVAVGADVWLVNPGRPIHPIVSEMHGITDADVANLPGFDAVEAEVRAALDGCVLVGHSLASDMDMLEQAMPDVWDLPAAMVDSRRLARAVGLGREKSNLDAIAAELGIGTDVAGTRGGRHTAERDALVSGSVFRAAAALLPTRAKHRRSVMDQAAVRKPGRLLRPEGDGGMRP